MEPGILMHICNFRILRAEAGGWKNPRPWIYGEASPQINKCLLPYWIISQLGLCSSTSKEQTRTAYGFTEAGYLSTNPDGCCFGYIL